MTVEVSGIDELRQRYVDDIIVETQAVLRDGKPFAIKLRQMRPVAFMAMGRGIPIPKERKNGDDADGDESEHERYEYMRRVVSRSVVAIREAVLDNGDWTDYWRDVEVVVERAPKDDGEIAVDDIDFLDNVTRCWNALFANITGGGRLAGTEAATFRPQGNGDAVPRGEALEQVAPRDSVRRKRQAGV